MKKVLQQYELGQKDRAGIRLKVIVRKRERDRQTDRQIDRQTERERETELQREQKDKE